jgi:hypothetical protein
MKIDPNISSNVQPQDFESTPAGTTSSPAPPGDQLEQADGPIGTSQQALSPDHDPGDPNDFSQDFFNGTALLLGGGTAAFGIGAPLVAIAADPSIIDWAGDKFDSAFDWFGGELSSIGHGIGGVLGDGLDWLGGVISDTPEAIGDAFSWSLGAITDAGNAIQDGAEAVADAAGDVVDAAADAVDAVGGAVAGAVSDALDW